MSDVDDLAWIPRWLAGACGGIAAALAKYLGHDHSRIADFLLNDEPYKAINLGIGYAVFIPLLMALAALVCFFSSEPDRRKLFIMGIAAPALVTTALPKSDVKLAWLAPISVAYAADQKADVEGISIIQGIKLFLGVEEERKYRVIVGSFEKPEEASELARRVNAENPNLNAFVGQRLPNNQFYPVVVSGFVPLAEATKIQEGVLQMKSVNGAYLSPYRWR